MIWFLGGTGSVGSASLARLVEGGHEVVAIGRRATGLAGVRDHLLRFEPGFETHLPDGEVDVVVSALGSNYVSMESRAEFWFLDYEVPLAVARVARARGARRFVLVSTLGAHRFAPMLFARAKGRLEETLRGLGFERVDVLRPGFILDSRVPRVGFERAAVLATERLAACSPRFARGPLRPTTTAEVATEIAALLPR